MILDGGARSWTGKGASVITIAFMVSCVHYTIVSQSCGMQVVAKLRVCGRSWRPKALSLQLCGDLETWHFHWPQQPSAPG